MYPLFTKKSKQAYKTFVTTIGLFEYTLYFYKKAMCGYEIIGLSLTDLQELQGTNHLKSKKSDTSKKYKGYHFQYAMWGSIAIP